MTPAEITPNWWYHVGLPIDIVCGVLLAAFIGITIYQVKKGSKKESK